MSIAILASLLLFSIIPLLRVGQVLLIEQHFRSVSQTRIPFDSDNPTAPFATGGDFTGTFSDPRLLLQTVLGGVFLGIGLLAWRGRPAYTRLLLITAVLLYSGLTIGLTLLPQIQAAEEGVTGGSMQAVANALQSGQLIMAIALPLYVVWYLNRAPARAFYQGVSENQHPDRPE